MILTDEQLPAVVSEADTTVEQRAVFDSLGSARAMRYLKPDVIDRKYIDALVWAGTRASSADNTQPWTFIAVSDADQRRAIADAIAPFQRVIDTLPDAAPGTQTRTRTGSRHLVDSLGDVPLLLFICGSNDYPAGDPQERYMWSAVFAAAQNVVVAARALGLGAVFSMLHVAAPREIRSILGVPAETRIAVMLTIGWPERPFGSVTRKPVEEVLRHDRW